MKPVLCLFAAVVSSGAAFQKYLWHLNLVKHIPVFPTQLNVAQVFLILWFNRGYFKGKLLFACRINFLLVFHMVRERAKVFKHQFFTQSFLSASCSLSDYSRDYPAPLPAGSGEHRESPCGSKCVFSFVFTPFSCVFSSVLPGCQYRAWAAWRRRVLPTKGRWATVSLPLGKPGMPVQGLGDKQETEHQWGGQGWFCSCELWGGSGRSPWAGISALQCSWPPGHCEDLAPKWTSQNQKIHPQNPPEPTNQHTECSSEAAPETAPAQPGQQCYPGLGYIFSPAQLCPLEQALTAAPSCFAALTRETQTAQKWRRHFPAFPALPFAVPFHSLPQIHILINSVAVDSQSFSFFF